MRHAGRIRRAVSGILLLGAVHHIPRRAGAQQWPLHYPEPPAGAVRIMKSIRFATVDTQNLAMDVYRPANATASAAAIIFWPPDRRSRETNSWLTSWARIGAANGIVGIIAEMEPEPDVGNAASTPSRETDFQRLLVHVSEHASEYGIDRERLAVFAGSGPVAAALPAVEDPRMTAIKAAVMYYGGARANVTTFRLDLPILYVRAGLDSRGMNAAIDQLVSRAVEQNAPVTLLNYHTGHHGFESRDDNLLTRQVIEQTIDFVKRATTPAYHDAMRGGQLDAVAAAHLKAGNYRDAALSFAELVKQRPADRLARLSYGQVLLADKQYGMACTELRKLTPRGDGSFEAIVPGARACLLAGVPDTAMAWLQSMPKEWVRSPYSAALQRDSVFAPLWARADFQALIHP